MMLAKKASRLENPSVVNKVKAWNLDQEKVNIAFQLFEPHFTF